MPANANEEVATAKREEKKRCICFIRSSTASSKRSSSQRAPNHRGWKLGSDPYDSESKKRTQLLLLLHMAVHLKAMH